MPLAEMMTFGVLSSFIATESSFDTESLRPGNMSGFTPERMTACISSSTNSVSHWRNTVVASMASGLST